MHLKILGTRGEIDVSSRNHKKQSGLLIDNELLVDIGEKSYLKLNSKIILITHLHPDHAYFVRRGKQEIPNTKATIFAPEKYDNIVKIISRKRKFEDYIVTPIPTHHSKYVKSQAYLIEKDKKSILYTGDIVWIDKKYHHLFDKVDLVITEGSFFREGGMVKKDKETGKLFGHNGIPNLIHLFKPHTDKILFMHFGSWFFKNLLDSKRKLLALGKKYGVEIIVGYDSMELDI